MSEIAAQGCSEQVLTSVPEWFPVACFLPLHPIVRLDSHTHFSTEVSLC